MSVPEPRQPVDWRPDRTAAISPDGEEVWLFGGAGPVRLAGRGAGPLAGAVDGRRDLAGVVAAAVAAGMPGEVAERLAQRWWRSGHLVQMVATPPPRVRLTQPAGATQPADTTRTAGTDADGSAIGRLAAALEAAGVVVQNGPAAGSALTVVVVSDLLDTLDALDALADIDGTVLAVQLGGDRPLVSPLLHADASCPRCLVQRLALRRAVDLMVASRVGLATPPPAPIRAGRAVVLAAGAIAAAAAAHASGDPAAPHRDHLSVIDLRTGAIAHHRLTAVAGCPRCDPDGPTVQARHLADRAPGGGADRSAPPASSPSPVNDDSGGLRVVDPAETWERFAHLVGDVVGLVPYVRPTGPREVRAFSAGPNVAAEADLTLLRSKLRSAAGGKGITLTGARTGALAEALERHSLRAVGGERSVRARLVELDGAIHPNDIQLFSDAQLSRAQRLAALGIPAEHTGHHRVPLPFDTEAEHDWSPVTDLRTGEVAWLPSSLVWFAWPGLPDGYPTGSSNGAAAGNTVTEALLQGLMELVERDSVALWWYPRCHRPAIDLDGWDDPRVLAALAPQRSLGSEFWVLDLTADTGIPAAAAVATGVGPWPQAPLVGFGAHLDPALAVVRALTELAQMQAPIIDLPPGTAPELPGEPERRWFSQVTPISDPWLAPQGWVSPAPQPSYTDVADAVDDALDRLTSRGLRVLWADCTRPDIGLPVVRTWAPGLRHFWRRYAPGRLFDVPPALGWRDAGYGEDDLNPQPMIL